MALISAKTIITSLSLFHITLGFFFLTDPKTVNEQALVYILGESMRMPFARGFDAQSHPLALLATVLALVGFTDLVSLSMPEDVAILHYWATQAPLRFLFFSIPLAYTLITAAPLTTSRGHIPASSPITAASGFKNRVAFTFMFIEMVSWAWVWVTLREERDGVVQRARRTRSKSVSRQ